MNNKNIKHKLFITVSVILPLSLLISSSLYAVSKKHVIRLVPGQEIYFSSYNISCTKNNSFIRNNTHSLPKNIIYKGKVEVYSNNIKLGSKALVKIDNFKIKCLASDIFKGSNKVFIDDDDDDDYTILPKTTTTSVNIFEILSDEENEDIHPRCNNDKDFSIFEEQDSGFSSGKSIHTTTKDGSFSIRIDLNG